MLSVISYAGDKYWLLFSAVLSLCLGSFINVVIYRLPAMMENEDKLPLTKPLNLFLPHSFCPSCLTTLLSRDNVPLFSWLLLRGRCRYCRCRISARYPLIELFMMLTGIVLASYTGIGTDWLFMLLFAALLTALVAIDCHCQLLPDPLTLLLLWVGLLWHCMEHVSFLPAAIVGAVAGYMTLWLLYWAFRLATGREGLGYGDFKLLAALGAWGGYTSLPLILLFASGGSLIWLALRVLRGTCWSQPLPFGPGLAVAGAAAVVYQWLILPADF
ncbi:prepilin peptidase [Erwiniaceae bacterium CAU 1747]